MKYLLKINLLVLTTLLYGSAFAQSDSSASNGVILDSKRVKVVIKEKEVMKKTAEGVDTLVKKIETVEIKLKEPMESEEDKDIAITEEIGVDPEEEEKDDDKFITTDWSNFGLGLNNLINSKGALETDAAYTDMGIIAGKSINLDWKIVTQAMSLYKNKVRLVYGIGIDFNNYRFEKNINLVADSVPLQVSNSTTDYKKNKLVTQHLTVPVLLNFKLAPKKNSDEYLYISAGANFGYLIGSHQKQVWNDKGKKKTKIQDDFNLEQYRIGYEVQFGYKNIVLFGKYFPKSMYKQGEGPNLRTVSAGILIGKV